MLNRLLIFFGLLFLSSFARAQVTLQDTSKFVAAGRSISVLEDKTARLSFDQVHRRSDFVLSQSETFQPGYTNSAYWFRFEVKNESRENEKRWLIGLLDAISIDYVDLYLVYPNGRVVHQLGGLRRPYVDQGFFATAPFFRVTFPVNQPVTVYFRIASSLSMFGKVTVWDEYYNLSKGRFIIFVLWMFLGLFILRSLNNFVLARFIPDPQFRFYALCTFLLYISTLARTRVFPLLLSGSPRLLEWMEVGMVRLLPVGLAVWMYSLLDGHPAFKPLRWLLLGIAGIGLVGVFLPFYAQNAVISQFYARLLLLTYFLFCIGVVLVWTLGRRPVLYLVLPMTLCIIPFALYQMQTLGILRYATLIGQLPPIALAIEMVSMSLVLGRIVQTYIKERIAAGNALMLEKVEVDKLQELGALKTRFFTNISHEFRTPLTLILGPIEQAVEDYSHDPRFPLIQRNANRLLSLINQLLDLSKLEADQLQLELSRDDMAAFFRILASSFSSLAQSRQINFSFLQEQTPRWADFDRDKLEKIVTNLLANAFKFTPAGQQVRLDIEYPAPGSSGPFRFIVADTGIGIAAENLAHIFDRFYQGSAEAVDGQSNRTYEGTGIGLALVSELVRVLDGRIEVTSTVGIGSTFTVTLPFLAADAPPDAPNTTFPMGTAKGLPPELVPTYPMPASVEVTTSENVLLVIDDNADIRAYVRSIFAADYQVIEAVDGQEGLEKATATLPDIVICDLMMPRLDGFGFCQALKTQEATSHIPVVMLTAKATTRDRIDGFERGADDYLTKPFNRDEIRARVRNLVQQRQRLRGYFAGRRAEASLSPELLPVAEPILPPAEQQFLDRLTAIINEHLNDPGFGVEVLAEAIGLGRVQLYRKLKALTDTSVVDFIRNVRLAKAADLLNQGQENVTQVAYSVGFENLSYFSKVFQERYGVLPSHYVKPSETAP